MTDLEFHKKRAFFEKAHQNYMEKRAKLPPFRLNIYLEGHSGKGKSFTAETLAKLMFPNKPEDETFCQAGGDGVALQTYNEQPCIIWNEARAGTLINQFGRKQVLEMFEMFPKKVSFHKKYGSVVLFNSVNIINGIQPYDQFLDGLVGEYVDSKGVQHRSETKDKEQIYRRVPLVISIDDDDYKILLNDGYQNNGTTLKYNEYQTVNGCIADLPRKFSGKAQQMMAEAMFQPVLDITKEITSKYTENKIENKEDIPDTYLLIGAEELTVIAYKIARDLHKWLMDNPAADAMKKNDTLMQLYEKYGIIYETDDKFSEITDSAVYELAYRFDEIDASKINPVEQTKRIQPIIKEVLATHTAS